VARRRLPVTADLRLLREAVLTARAVPLNSARGLILAGTGVVEDGDEGALADLFTSWTSPAKVREVPRASLPQDGFSNRPAEEK
jgi:hypothetical protein